jgi:uncharacterized protein with ParB-like and HNH nuclease domain
MPSVPEGVAKYVLIDGQQRLTTIFILLTILRDFAENQKIGKLSDKINNTFIVNQYEEKLDYFKIMPTDKGDNHNSKTDRKTFIKIIKKEIILIMSFSVVL